VLLWRRYNVFATMSCIPIIYLILCTYMRVLYPCTTYQYPILPILLTLLIMIFKSVIFKTPVLHELALTFKTSICTWWLGCVETFMRCGYLHASHWKKKMDFFYLVKTWSNYTIWTVEDTFLVVVRSKLHVLP
jgi:hypothetical protein